MRKQRVAAVELAVLVVVLALLAAALAVGQVAPAVVLVGLARVVPELARVVPVVPELALVGRRAQVPQVPQVPLAVSRGLVRVRLRLAPRLPLLRSLLDRHPKHKPPAQRRVPTRISLIEKRPATGRFSFSRSKRFHALVV